MASGIVSYTSCLVRALKVLSASPLVLTSPWVGGNLEDFVRRVPEYQARTLRQRIEAKVMAKIDPDRWRASSFASVLLDEIRQLHTTVGLDIVEFEETFGWAHWLANASPVPIVVRLHGPWFLNGPANGAPEDASFRQRIRYEGRGIEAAAAVTAPSRWVLEKTQSYFGLNLRQAQVIPNPVDLPSPEHSWTLGACDRNRILFVGRFDRGKGGDITIDAFSRVIQHFPEARLDFVGDDSGFVDEEGNRWGMSQFVDARLASREDRAKVRYLGFQPPAQLAELRRRSLLTIVSSRYETFPMTALEAMAMGCPLIASEVGGLSEIVQDRRNGLLCVAGDSDDLANKISSLLKDHDLAVRLGRQAAADCQSRYNPQAIARQTLDFYRSVVDRWTG
jgi:glycosyltransferase involved in cell wall biosynthesis